MGRPDLSVRIHQQEFDRFLIPMGFQTLELPGTNEVVYAKVFRRNDRPFSVRIYSSVENGVSRDKSEDAIRVQCFLRHNDKILRVGGTRRVHRMENWRAYLLDRIDNWSKCLGPDCPTCTMPMVLRKPKTKRSKKQFKPFFGCSQFPYCDGTVEVDDVGDLEVE